MGIAEKIIENQDREGMLRRSLERIIQLYTDKSHFVCEHGNYVGFAQSVAC